MIDKNGLDNDDYSIISELVMWKGEPLKAKDLKGISNPATHLKRLERLGYIQEANWDYEGKYYKPVIRNLLKAGIIEKSKLGNGYNIYMGTFKHDFELCFDVPTEKGLMTLFKGLDKIRERDYGLWKALLRMISNAMYNSFVKTERGFLTEEDAWKLRKERMDFDRQEEEEMERHYIKHGKSQMKKMSKRKMKEIIEKFEKAKPSSA